MSKQPRVPAGSPQGGQWAPTEGGTLYHGTTARMVDRIKSEGLKLSEAGKVWSQESIRDGEGAVYVTSTREDAERWARAADRQEMTSAPGWVPGKGKEGKTAIIEIRVPKSEASKFKVDSVGMEDLTFTELLSSDSPQRLMAKQDIPPEWIASVTILEPKEPEWRKNAPTPKPVVSKPYWRR